MPDVPTIVDFETVFGNMISVALALAGIVLFIVIVIGGIKYITSAGDPKAVEGARKTLTYAIGGLVLLLLSYLILVFIQKFTGVNTTQFILFQP